MKKYSICIFISIVLLAMLVSCGNFDSKTATPGEVCVLSKAADDAAPYSSGYRANIAPTEATMAALDISFDYDAPENALTSIDFNGKQYAVQFLSSGKGFMRRTWEDDYRANPNDEGIKVFYVNRGSGKLIGYMKEMVFQPVPSEDALSREELTNIAREGLGAFVDASYYAHTDISYSSETYLYTVKFYNTFDGVEVADSSMVDLRGDGTLVQVTDWHEPEILEAMRGFSNFDTAAFDSRVETETRAAYPDYRRDDNEMYVDVAYNGVEISFRQITLDDDGRPVVVYGVTPQLNYNVVYRGESATLMAGRGLATQESGVSQQTVYITVGLE